MKLAKNKLAICGNGLDMERLLKKKKTSAERDQSISASWNIGGLCTE